MELKDISAELADLRARTEEGYHPDYVRKKIVDIRIALRKNDLTLESQGTSEEELGRLVRLAYTKRAMRTSRVLLERFHLNLCKCWEGFDDLSKSLVRADVDVDKLGLTDGQAKVLKLLIEASKINMKG